MEQTGTKLTNENKVDLLSYLTIQPDSNMNLSDEEMEYIMDLIEKDIDNNGV